METRAATLMMLDVSRLLGHDELGLMTDNDRELFRVLTPVSKLYTAKQAMKVVSEGLECFGGMGYLEDTGLPQIFRDAQVILAILLFSGSLAISGSYSLFQRFRF